MAITAQDLITRTLILIGAIDSGNTPTTDESDDALLALNEMLANWAEDHISVNFRTKDEIALTQGLADYTWGIGGDINTARPVDVRESWLEDSDGSSYSFDIKMGAAEYSRIALKGSPGRPSRGWYQTTYPLGKLSLDNAPDAAYTLHVLSIKEFSEFSTLSAESVLPTSYTRALRYNLAVEIGPEYSAPLDPRTIDIADKSLKKIKAGNLVRRVNKLSCDNAITGSRSGYDIRIG